MRASYSQPSCSNSSIPGPTKGASGGRLYRHSVHGFGCCCYLTVHRRGYGSLENTIVSSEVGSWSVGVMGAKRNVQASSTTAAKGDSVGRGDTVLSGGLLEMDDLANPGDLFLVTLHDGTQWYLETIRGKKKSLRFVCQGEHFKLRNGELLSEGYYPKLSDSWVKGDALLVSCLEELRRLQKAGDVVLPSVILGDPQLMTKIDKVEFVTSLSDFEKVVSKDPRLWCDGTGPEDGPLNAVDQSLLTAGELLALLNGYRGVALLQLSLPLDMGGHRLPLLRPFVFEILKRINDSKEVIVLPSKISGGAAVSHVIAAKRQPFASWGAYLSDLGVQASIVADSAFYKMIIGRIMGYRPENIEHHIISTGGVLTPDISRLVEEELRKLSEVEPTLPWK